MSGTGVLAQGSSSVVAAAAAGEVRAAGRGGAGRGGFVSVRGVGKSFGAQRVLSDISLEFGRGEFVVLLGPSGCGKTTLLRIIAGLEKQDSGRVLMDGEDVSGDPPASRGCGIVFQSYALFPNLSALDNVKFAVPRDVPRVQRRRQAESLLDRVGLLPHAAKYPSQMSGGQQQRVALARAIAQRPRILLLDEPLGALDAEVRQQLRQTLRDVQREHALTSIMVTHDQQEALELADQLVVMHRGRVDQSGTAREVFEEPETVFTAGFLGGMNILTYAGFYHACMRDAGIAGASHVGFRPDSGRENRSAAETFGLELRVVATVFRGESVRVRGNTATGETVHVDLPADRVVSEGETLRVQLQPEALKWFAADGRRAR